MPDPIFLILSLSKDARSKCNESFYRQDPDRANHGAPAISDDEPELAKRAATDRHERDRLGTAVRARADLGRIVFLRQSRPRRPAPAHHCAWPRWLCRTD